MAKGKKKIVAAVFFLLVPLLTVAPFILFRSPAPVGIENGIAVCDPEYNPGPQAEATEEPEKSYREYLERLDQILPEDNSDKAAFTVVGGLLSYDRNLARIWLDAIGQHTAEDAVSAIVEEARRLSSNPDYAPCVVR